MIALTIAALMAFQGGTSVVEPAYPADAYQGGTVVVALELEGGTVSRMTLLVGSDPFVAPTLTALKKWQFPKERKDRPALVIVNFRGPNLLGMGPAEQSVEYKNRPVGLPQPTAVAEPAYPADSLAEGSVILQLMLDSKGAVSETKVLKGLGKLTQACEDATGRWKMEPARTADGGSTGSDVFAVCVIRRPVLSP